MTSTNIKGEKEANSSMSLWFTNQLLLCGTAYNTPFSITPKSTKYSNSYLQPFPVLLKFDFFYFTHNFFYLIVLVYSV